MTITKESIADTIEGLAQLTNRGIHSVYIDMAIAGLRRLLAGMEQAPVTREDAIAKFREYNIGFPVERFKADYVIGWMLASYLPAVRTDARTLSESELNKLQGLIEAPPAPSQNLRDLMTRKPRYTTKPKSELLQRAEKLAEDTAALAERVGGSSCEWSYDDNDHKWDGKCGASWIFIEDGPAENSMHFCPGCGKPVSVAQAEDGE